MDEEVKENLIDKIFFKKYRCIEYIGEGSFSQIIKVEYNNKYYAMKVEDIRKKQKLLSNEASMMIYLKCPNIPYIVTYGSSGGFNILTMQLLGSNLQSVFEREGTFSIKTVCLLAYQILSVLEHIHNKGVIHRDIKPENFLLGNEAESNSKYLYLIDFGLSKFFDKNNFNDILTNKKKLTGTPRYASINAQRGFEQSMRDDLESVGYMLIYFLKGKLPWMGIEGKNQIEKNKKICIRKIETSSSDLCYGLPKQFVEYFDYCKELEFHQMPDYSMLKELFMKMLRSENEKFDYIYDWDVDKKYKKKKFDNLGFYCRSVELGEGEGNANLDGENKPIGKQGLNYTDMVKQMENDLNDKNKKVNDDKENEEKNKKEEKKSSFCFIF